MYCTLISINTTSGHVMILFTLIIMASTTKSRPSKKRGLRSSNTRLSVLSTSPGEQHLQISGTKLPTYEQVLLCYMATMEKLRAEDSTKNRKLTADVSNAVFEKVRVHYEKGNIPTKNPKKCAQDILKLNDEFKSVNKFKTTKRIEKFRTKLRKTMPFWARGTLESMEKKIANNLTSEFERKRLEEDSGFLRKMMGSRDASCTSNDVEHQKNRVKGRKRQPERLPSKRINKKKNRIHLAPKR